VLGALGAVRTQPFDPWLLSNSRLKFHLRSVILGTPWWVARLWVALDALQKGIFRRGSGCGELGQWLIRRVSHDGRTLYGDNSRAAGCRRYRHDGVRGLEDAAAASRLEERNHRRRTVCRRVCGEDHWHAEWPRRWPRQQHLASRLRIHHTRRASAAVQGGQRTGYRRARRQGRDPLPGGTPPTRPPPFHLTARPSNCS